MTGPMSPRARRIEEVIVMIGMAVLLVGTLAAYGAIWWWFS